MAPEPALELLPPPESTWPPGPRSPVLAAPTDKRAAEPARFPQAGMRLGTSFRFDTPIALGDWRGMREARQMASQGAA